MLKCVLILLATSHLTGCVGTAIAILEGDTSELERELEDLINTSGTGVRRGNADDLQEFYAGLDRPDIIDISTTSQTAIIGIESLGYGHCYLGQPATTRRVVVDAGATSISALCSYFRNDSLRTGYTRFDLTTEPAKTYSLVLVFADVENISETNAGECVALFDKSTNTRLGCNELNDLPDFDIYGNIATSEETAEVLGDLPQCGVTTPYRANTRWRKGDTPPIHDKIIVDPGRLRVYAACLRHGFSKDEYYRAAFEFDVTPGTSYRVKRLKKGTDFAVATPDGCIPPINAKEAVPIVLCAPDASPPPSD